MNRLRAQMIRWYWRKSFPVLFFIIVGILYWHSTYTLHDSNNEDKEEKLKVIMK